MMAPRSSHQGLPRFRPAWIPGGTAPLWICICIFVSLLLGWAVAEDQVLVLVVVSAALALAALDAPASLWIFAALLFTIVGRGIVGLGLLPSLVSYIDIPLCWGALLLALIRRRQLPLLASRVVRLVVLLAVAAGVSTLFNGTELLRSVIYLLILGQPFAIVGALLLDPPSARMRQVLLSSIVFLAVIQIPIAVVQFLQHGEGDPVQGTLYGAGAGAHLLSALAVIGAVLLLQGLPRGKQWRIPLAALLAAIPVIADGKQVLATAPLLLLVGRWRTGPSLTIRLAFLAVAVFAIGTYGHLHPTQAYLRTAETGQGGKPLVARLVWHDATSDPASLLFGKGPATTVSRTAFALVPGYLQNSSIPSTLGLKPSPYSTQIRTINAEATGVDIHSYEGTSFNSAISSALGVFGDLGVLGALVYACLLATLFLGLFSSSSRLAGPAMGLLSMYFVLGFIYDWWEEPAFTVLVGIIVSLGLLAPSGSSRDRRPNEHTDLLASTQQSHRAR